MFDFIKKAINGGKTINTSSGGFTGWNRDVDSSDPEFDGCLVQPFMEMVGYGQACLKLASPTKAVDWAQHVYGGLFILPEFWGDGKTPNPAPCKKHNKDGELEIIKGRYHYLFVRKGSRHDKTANHASEVTAG